MNAVDERFSKAEVLSQDHQQYMEQKITELKHYFAKQSDQIYKLQEFQKESTKFQEKTRNDHDKTQKRIDSVVINAHGENQATYEKGLAKLKELEAATAQQIKDVNESLRE